MVVAKLAPTGLVGCVFTITVLLFVVGGVLETCINLIELLVMFVMFADVLVLLTVVLVFWTLWIVLFADDTATV